MEKYKKVIKKINLKYQLQPTWNEEFELHDGSYSASSDIQENFDYIIKKHETVTDNSSMKYI